MKQPTQQLLELAEFNDARLDEQERDARAAQNDRNDYHSWHQMADLIELGLGEGEALHIAAYSPARALADVTAKRALIASWRELILRIDAKPTGEMRELLILARRGLDQTARQLAVIHSDHADYKPEWRP